MPRNARDSAFPLRDRAMNTQKGRGAGALDDENSQLSLREYLDQQLEPFRGKLSDTELMDLEAALADSWAQSRFASSGQGAGDDLELRRAREGAMDRQPLNIRRLASETRQAVLRAQRAEALRMFPGLAVRVLP